MEGNYNKNSKILTLNTINDHVDRSPIHICCVVDVSGSMGIEATIIDETNNKESTGLSVLNLVLYAVRTVIKSLKDGDMVSVVAFSSNSRIVLNPTDVSEWETIDNNLKTMNPMSMTNLWSGLKYGIDITNNVDMRSTIFLFTDGIPNIDPPRGYGYELNKIDYKCTIHTFGFGYSINTEVLTLISKMGHGSFNFIPDAGMVGTVFIHAISNVLAQYAQNIMVNGKNIGTLRYGQPRHIYFETIIDDKIEYTDNNMASKTIDIQENDSFVMINDRFILIECIQKLLGINNDKINIINKCIEDITNNEYINDLDKEIRLAINNENFERWGMYYLQSLLNAHEQEYCNNFRDPGIQGYGIGILFNAERSNAENMFNNLPLPTPTFNRNSSFSLNNMTNTFLNSNSGCFSGDSIIHTDKGATTVNRLRVGDTLINKTVVKYIVIGPEVDMIRFNGFDITHWHPIMHEDDWVFPVSINEPNMKIVKRKSYNIVLGTKGDTLIMGTNKVSVAPLGHNIKGNVIGHEYLGTQRVVDDLAKLDKGSGIIDIIRFTRDPNTYLINGV